MRILFATTRGAGHVGPLVPFARACLRAGHEVLVAGPASAEPLVRRAGLTFRAVAEPPAHEVRAAWAPVFGQRSAAPAAAYVVRELFVGLHAGTALPDMLTTVADWDPDIVVRETCEFSSALAAERFDIPQVQVGVHLAWQTDVDGRLLSLAAGALDELRDGIGLEPDGDAQAIRRAPVFTLAPRSLDDPGAPEPATIRRFRESARIPAVRSSDFPLVYVSFGSEAPTSEHFPGVYRAAAEALAELPVRVLMTIGDQRDPAELGPLPASVQVERWVSQAVVMPHAAAMVGHGGSGSTLIALAAGVPQVFVPLFVDGPVNAKRVAELGAGIALQSPEGLAGAVQDLLATPRYTWAAGLVAAEIGGLPPIDEAVVELEEVLRGASSPAFS